MISAIDGDWHGDFALEDQLRQPKEDKVKEAKDIEGRRPAPAALPYVANGGGTAKTLKATRYSWMVPTYRWPCGARTVASASPTQASRDTARWRVLKSGHCVRSAV